MKTIAVIGAGASGIIASLFASRENNHVMLFEKQSRIGKKILITGNGRCNISNKFAGISHYNGHNTEFVSKVLSNFGIQQTLNYFETLGIPVIEEEHGRLYPASMQASSVLDIFSYELNKKKIELLLNNKIERVMPEKKGFRLKTAEMEEYLVDSIIISCGSSAGPEHGASETGYAIAASLGHKIYKPFPAILPINIPLKIIHTLEGVKWMCRVYAEQNGKIISESKDELLFTKYGISGPAALNISRAVNQECIEHNNPVIYVDFFPDLPEKMLSQQINNLWKDPDKSVLLSLSGIIKKRIPEVLLKINNIDSYKSVKKLNESEKIGIIKTLKAFKLIPGNPRLFKEAVVAAGGIDVEEINPDTMESRIIKNLYITGELLDIDGNSGGYNLQFAWSTGALAGMAQ